ncbi:MAG TPA: hypothetical protein IGS53_12445 [Leptolyngbyaceae cyanobacterium M33_DOE_097]|nr:hypothetical protein [Leptolyngbyaceae cyanobacterium M33_DOE_097]
MSTYQLAVHPTIVWVRWRSLSIFLEESHHLWLRKSWIAGRVDRLGFK